MDIIGTTQLWSISSEGKQRRRSCFNIRKASACLVSDYLELATNVAKLQFKNPGFVLLFRGQTKDYMRENKAGISFTSLMPSLFRGEEGGNIDGIRRRYERLEKAETALLEEYKKRSFPEFDKLERQKILRWAILQHYEVCPTPLLDVTNSLRIAASFASDNNDGEAYIFVLGVPNLSGAITASAESGLNILRLSSVCPPAALRPHIQEGYLLGEYPEMLGISQKKNYKHFEIDFGRRLIAKFKFDPNTFWKKDAFQMVSHAERYPNKSDPLHKLTRRIQKRL